MTKTPTQQFIEDAIAGGWKASPELSTYEMKVLTIEKMRVTCEYLETCTIDFDVRMPLLDPLSWQAVGKTRGWNGDWFGEVKRFSGDEVIETNRLAYDPYEYKMHHFIDHLADGKTIDQSLLAIS